MEYRRRRRGGVSRKQMAATPAYIAIFVVFFGIVYLLSASRLSTYIAENWIAPVLKNTVETAPPAMTAPGTSAEPVTVVMDTVTKEITLAERTTYALQMGAYSRQENAQAQSNALKAIGAAGYVLQDGERYRVLASAYKDAESADKVAAQLLAEGVESRQLPLTRSKRVFTVTGTVKQIEAIQNAVEGVDPMIGQLYDAYVAFDKEQQSVSQGIAGLSEIRMDVQRHLTALSEVDSGETAISEVNEFYQTVDDGLAELIANDGASVPALSSGIKQLHIQALLAWQ